jgi:hypothetical protein
VHVYSVGVALAAAADAARRRWRDHIQPVVCVSVNVCAFVCVNVCVCA